MRKKNKRVKAKVTQAQAQPVVTPLPVPKSPRVKVGKIDEVKAKQAKISMTAGGMQRQAGMMLDGVNTTNLSYAPGFVLEGYRNSYASGLGYKSGTYDIPTFVQVMNQKNGGIIQFPMSIQEKYSLFRYYARTDSLVGRALDLLSDLPMSKLCLHMPNFVPEGIKEEIRDFFESQVVKLDLFNNCSSILYELNCIGMTHLFVEYNEEKKCWDRIQMLPPEEVFVFEYPFSDEKRIEYRPRRIVSLIQGQATYNELEEGIIDSIPDSIKDSIEGEGCILLDSDPMNGSFCHSIARRKAPYMDISSSILDRVLIPLQLKDYYKYTQLSLASRNMTPKNLIVAPNCSPEDLDLLRTQIDLSYLDPDYSIVTNFDVRWETIGARDRLLELTSEYERLDNEIFAAMGVTRELLTGEGSYSGTKITVEILHTMFLRAREILVNFIEQKLFLPLCEKRGWFEEDKNGIKKYFYPKVGFNRLSIRDNSEVFDSLFQLYQKGSLPVDILYELFNLDTTEIDDKLYKDLFTVRDATFNELVRGVLSEAGRNLADNSDVMEKISKYLRLNYKKPDEGGEAGGGMPGMETAPGGEQPGMDLSTLVENSLGEQQDAGELEAEVPAEETPAVAPEQETNFDTGAIDIEKEAGEIASELPVNATAEEIMNKIINKEKTLNELTEEEKDALSDLIIKSLPPGSSEEDIIKEIITKSKGVVK